MHSHRKPLATLVAFCVMSGQLLAVLPGACGCSDLAQVESSCCAIQSVAPTCCCGEQTSVRGCGCTDNESSDEPAPVDENRFSVQLISADDTSIPDPFAVPRTTSRLLENQNSGFSQTTSSQVLFCIWQT